MSPSPRGDAPLRRPGAGRAFPRQAQRPRPPRAETMPCHCVIARCDRHAGTPLRAARPPRRRAGWCMRRRSHRRRRGRHPLRRGLDRGDRDARGVAVVPPIERRDGSDVDAAVAKYRTNFSLICGAYGVNKPILLAPRARNAASAAVTGVVQATFGRALRISAKTASSPSTMVADVQPKRRHRAGCSAGSRRRSARSVDRWRARSRA